jgi:hypothetical protein
MKKLSNSKHNIHQREYYENNKSYFYKLRKKEYLIKYPKCKKILNELKINGCSICGYNKNPNCLDFHHVNPKNKKFPLMIGNIYAHSNEKIIKELNKCILLCKNCHYDIERWW